MHPNTGLRQEGQMIPLLPLWIFCKSCFHVAHCVRSENPFCVYCGDLTLRQIPCPFLLPNWNKFTATRPVGTVLPTSPSVHSFMYHTYWSILGSFSFSFLLCCASVTRSYLNLPEPKRDFLSYTLNDAKIHSSTISKSLERNQVIFISIPAPPILLAIQTAVIQSPTKFLKTMCVKGVFMQLQEMLHPLLQTAVTQKGLTKMQSSWSWDGSWLSMCMQTAREYFSCFKDTVKYWGCKL